MIKAVVNAKALDGHLYTLSFSSQTFSEIKKQNSTLKASGKEVFDAQGLSVYPGMIDGHVHVREPGLTHKEDWESFARAAFKGGVVAACDMPNTVPPTMTLQDIKQKAAIAAKSGLEFGLYVGVSDSNVSELGKILREGSKLPICGLKIYYGHSTGNLMFNDLPTLAKALQLAQVDPLIVFHSEDQCCIDDNEAKFRDRLTLKHNRDFVVHSQIRSSEAALRSTKVILDWAKKYDMRLHLAHLSTPEEVELMQEAKTSGVRITGEVAPHHLLFSEDDYETLGPFLKINPPVRPRESVERLRKLFAAGYIDCFATDHAPHTKAEKQNSNYHAVPSGAPGIEFYLPLLFKLAQDCGLSTAAAVTMATSKPAEIFGFKNLSELKVGSLASFSLVRWQEQTIRNDSLISKCQWSPYDGIKVPCQVASAWHRGQLRYGSDDAKK